MIVLLVMVAYLFKIPFAVPISFALMGTPSCIIPIIFGTMIYSMISYLETSATAVTGAQRNGREDLSVCVPDSAE